MHPSPLDLCVGLDMLDLIVIPVFPAMLFWHIALETLICWVVQTLVLYESLIDLFLVYVPLIAHKVDLALAR